MMSKDLKILFLLTSIACFVLLRIALTCIRQVGASEQHNNHVKDHLLLNTFIQKDVKLIDKMSLGAGALKVEGPVAQEGSLALEITMATKQASTTCSCHTERVQWNTYHNPYLPIRGWEEWEQNQLMAQAVDSNDLQRSEKQSKAELRYAITCQPLQPKWPPCTSLPAWGSTADSLALSQG